MRYFMNEKQLTGAIDDLAQKAEKALDIYKNMDQESIDKIVKEMTLAAIEHRFDLALMAARETNRGVLEDKIIKNMFAAEEVWNYVKNKKTVTGA